VRPDQGWSEWSEPGPDKASPAVRSPNARYVQWRLEIAAGSGAPPLVDSVTLSYQTQNNRPQVRSITVTPQWTAAAQKAAGAAAPAATSYAITVTDAGEAPQTAAGTPSQPVARSGVPQVLLTWQADDPDGDKLTYTLAYRAEDEREWKTLKADLTENTFLQDADTFADGRYFFRVTASDRAANSPATARDAELVSPPVLIDQTPPRVTLAPARRDGKFVEIRVEAADSASTLRRAEFSVNGSPWRVLDAADGVMDGLSESFLVRFEAGAGEQSVVVRVLDSAGNAGLARQVVR
jgi:hypothetical protein